MQFEYLMLTLMTFFFLFAWAPVSYAKFQSFGGKWVASNREPLKDKELVAWGARADRAYSNLKDYFPAYAVSILLLGATHHFDYFTAIASAAYVVGRIGHYIAYTAGHVPSRFLTYVIFMVSNVFLLIKVLI